MMPRFSPIVTAWVRSLAPSLARMFLMWPFTVSSVMESCAAISLLAFPPEISLDFPYRQGIISGMLGEFRRHLGHHAFLPRMNETDGLQEFFPQQTLEQVA